MEAFSLTQGGKYSIFVLKMPCSKGGPSNKR